MSTVFFVSRIVYFVNIVISEIVDGLITTHCIEKIFQQIYSSRNIPSINSARP